MSGGRRTGSPRPTDDQVATLVRSALGRASRPTVRPVDEGGEHWSWWVDDDHVVRLAPDRAVSRRQRREIALRDLVRPYVGVPLPRSAAAGVWTHGRGFTVDSRLTGVSAETRPLSPAGEAQLAGLLRGLRAVPVARAAALDVSRAEPVRWERLAADAEAARGRLATVEGVPRTPVRAPAGAAPVGRVLVHGDLKGEHLLIHPDGTLAGVLDWADARLAEPVWDIAGLALAVGAPTAARAATAAGHHPRAAVWGVFLARAETLLRLDERVRGDSDSPLPLLRAQLARAWRDPAHPR